MYISASKCEIYFESYSCVVGGERITPDTGKPDHVYNVQELTRPIDVF